MAETIRAEDAIGSKAFQRGGLARTPPRTRKERIHSFNGPFPLLAKDQTNIQEEQVRKRKREERKSEENYAASTVKVFANSLKRLLEEIKEVQKMTEEYANTKRELKDAASAMVRRTLDVEFLWTNVEQELTQAKERTIQTETKGQEDISMKVRQAVQEGSFDTLKTVLHEQWPKELYTATEVATQADQGLEYGDIALIISPGKVENSKLLTKLDKRFPGLKDVAMEAETEIGFVIQTSQTRTSRNKGDTTSSAAYILPVKDGANADEKLCELHTRLRQLPKALENNPTDRIKLVAGGGWDQRTLRKVAESACAGANFKLVTRPLKDNKKNLKQKARPKQHKEEGVVAINTGNMTYADLVKKLKNEVDVGHLGIKVNRIRRTDKGNVLVAVDGGEEKAVALKEEIAKKNADLKITTRVQGRKKIFVLGMDSSTTEAELQKELAKVVHLGEERVKILSMRTGRFEDKTAIVEMPRQQAELLITDKRVKVGWLFCTVREHIEMQRCFNCLEHGHTAKDCKVQASRRDECLNCGEKGHRGKDCTNTPRCTKCGVDGHRADQMKCPHFKKEVERMRQKRLEVITKGVKLNKNGS